MALRRDDFVHQLEQHSLSPDTFVFGGRSGEQDLLYDKYMLRLSLCHSYSLSGHFILQQLPSSPLLIRSPFLEIENVAAMFVVATDSSATRFSVDGGYLMEPFNLFLRFEKCLAAVNEDMAEVIMTMMTSFRFLPSSMAFPHLWRCFDWKVCTCCEKMVVLKPKTCPPTIVTDAHGRLHPLR